MGFVAKEGGTGRDWNPCHNSNSTPLCPGASALQMGKSWGSRLHWANDSSVKKPLQWAAGTLLFICSWPPTFTSCINCLPFEQVTKRQNCTPGFVQIHGSAANHTTVNKDP